MRYSKSSKRALCLGELYLMNAHIAELETTNRHFARDSRTPRKLLLHKKELLKLYNKVHKDPQSQNA